MKTILTFLLTCLMVWHLDAETLVLEGKYQNKNVFVQNFFGNSGVGFCAEEIKVNGRITTDETNSSAFEIDLAALQLKFGDKVLIEIKHKEGCMPKVLNPEDLKPKPTFEVVTMTVNETGLLKWTTKNESGSLPYTIEQFKWNKWVPIGEVAGVGSPENHDYSFQVAMHSGENKYRVKQSGTSTFPKYSTPVTTNSQKEKPSYTISKDGKGLQFNTETAYEVYDSYGIIVKKGFGGEIKIENLRKGTFHLCYDNIVTQFDKK